MKRYIDILFMLTMAAVSIGAYGQHDVSNNVAGKERAANQNQHEFKDLDDRFSYAYGADLAEKFRAEGIELNVETFARAIRDVYGGGEMKMAAGEIAATLQLYFELHRKKKEEERLVAGKRNKKKGEMFLAENAKKEGVTVTNSGLQYKVIKQGDGGHRPDEDDIVTVHYRGKHIDGTEFDSTYQRDEAYTAKLNKLIQGWTEALRMMTEGSKWELYVPAHLAYGEEGSEPFIGPNAALIFEVELLEIEKQQ